MWPFKKKKEIRTTQTVEIGEITLEQSEKPDLFEQRIQSVLEMLGKYRAENGEIKESLAKTAETVSKILNESNEVSKLQKISLKAGMPLANNAYVQGINAGFLMAFEIFADKLKEAHLKGYESGCKETKEALKSNYDQNISRILEASRTPANLALVESLIKENKDQMLIFEKAKNVTESSKFKARIEVLEALKNGKH